MVTSTTLHKLNAVDGSGRINVGKNRAGTLYDIAYEPDGRVILTPMVAVPEREAWLHQNPAAMALVKKGLSEFAQGIPGSTLDLTQFPEDEE